MIVGPSATTATAAMTAVAIATRAVSDERLGSGEPPRSGFTCSAAVTYSALRLFGNTPPAELLAYEAGENDIEIYGESPSKPVFSASFNVDLERAAATAPAGSCTPAGPQPAGA